MNRVARSIDLILLIVGAVATSLHAEARDRERSVTFNANIAPILYENCAPCHRPAGPAPFPLLSFADARKRARQIVSVTRSRAMPPWLPMADYGEFVGARRLEDDEVALLRRWVKDGLAEGDAADLPPRPVWSDGWFLGTPDLTLALPQSYTLPAEGPDRYRNFVIPVPPGGTRWIEAVEIVPRNARVVHHARLLVDRTPASRRADADDTEPGYAGMTWGNAETPDGILVGWTPGKVPLPPTPGMAWRLDDRTDLVLQLHLVPSGKPEEVQVQIGLHFAQGPPTLHPFALLLSSRAIDIPAGESDYRVRDTYTLPVDVDVVGIYPHAHYLAEDMNVYARLPDGSRRWLLRIEDWDFNWQDEYHYARPLALPRGTVLHMDYVYDNSDDNPQNPSDPPRRVSYGPWTTDEMAELMLQVLPASAADLELLRADAERHKVEDAIAYRRELLRRDPEDHRSHAALGAAYLSQGRSAEAIPHLQQAVRLAPGDATAHNNLAFALQAEARHVEAIAEYRRAVLIDAELVEAHFGLGQLLLKAGDLDGAMEHLTRTVALQPEAAAAHELLAEALTRAGRHAAAAKAREAAARLHAPSR